MIRSERTAWIVSAVLLLGVAALWFFFPRRMPFGWLAAFTLFSLLPLGSLALLFIHALTGGRWGEAVRPGLLAGVGTLPLLPVLVLPVLFSLPTLYPWARPEGAALPNRFWLNPVFFGVRGAVELAVWFGLYAVVRRGGLARWAPVALPALAVTVTFAAIDFTMSLVPSFTSSIYGMIAGTGAVVFALARAVQHGPAPGAEVADDLGRLLLGLCALWTYLDFMQVLIVWQSDLVAQTPWYLARTAGGWGWVMALVTLAGGVGPILALLSPRVRRSRRGLLLVTGSITGAAVLRAWWTVLPPHPFGVPEGVCFAAVGFVAVGWQMRQARGAAGAA